MKQSAGLLVYRQENNVVEVLLVHPGGPFWAKKDKGAWSIPKGEFEEGEKTLDAAKREFREEIGQDPPSAETIELGSTKLKSGKVIYAWAVEGDPDTSNIISSSFEMEWPPRSGQNQEFPEVDRADWFTLEKATQQLNPAQTVFIDNLAEHLGFNLAKPEQPSLF